jgi:hypothetical protein
VGTILHWIDEKSGALKAVEFDLVETETPEDNTTITDHPVEEGVNVSDHARDEPIHYTVEGLVSTIPNPRIDDDAHTKSLELAFREMKEPGSKSITLTVPTPPVQLSESGLLQAGIGALVGLFAGPTKVTVRGNAHDAAVTRNVRVLQQDAPRDRVRDVYDLLLKARADKALVTILLQDRELFDMLIERVAKPRTLEDGKLARFQVDLRQLRVADSVTVQAPKPTEARGKGNVSKGSQGAKKKEGGEPVLESTLSMITPG